VSEESQEVLALIPARGGSRSLPRKNVRPLAGRPLLAWSVAAARASPGVGRVVLSTDDEEIRTIGRAAGAEAPFLRPAELARDDTTDLPVFEHALRWLEREEGYRPSLVVQLRPTSPLRPPGLVDRGIQLLRAHPQADSVRSVCPTLQNPFKMWRLEEPYLRPLLEGFGAEPYNMPRQKLPPTFWQTGQLDVARRATILGRRSMTGDHILPLIVDPAYAVDVDSPQQWPQLEWLVVHGGLDLVWPEGFDVPA